MSELTGFKFSGSEVPGSKPEFSGSELAKQASHQLEKPLCLTIGDYTGIGPEITAKFLTAQFSKPTEVVSTPPVMVIGHIPHLRRTAQQLGLALPETSSQVIYHDVSKDLAKESPGHMAYAAIRHAVQRIARGDAGGLVTGPISKEHLKQAGIPYTGHTEMLQDLATEYFPPAICQSTGQSAYQADMLFVHQQFRMLLLTRHIALREVSAALTVEQVNRSLTSLIEFLQTQAKLPEPRLGILGVNPHAGEIERHDSQTGKDISEETRILKPAMTLIQQKFNLSIDPPLPADAAFRQFNPQQPPYDCYVAAYHDQGLIPMKLVAGMQAVNVTIGLPFVRTSVSHGTAPDIAGKGIADASALYAAYDLACQLTEKKY